MWKHHGHRITATQLTITKGRGSTGHGHAPCQKPESGEDCNDRTRGTSLEPSTPEALLLACAGRP